MSVQLQAVREIWRQQDFGCCYYCGNKKKSGKNKTRFANFVIVAAIKNNQGNYNTRSAQLRWRVPSGSGDMAPTRFIFLKKQIKNNTRFANFVSVAANNNKNVPKAQFFAPKMEPPNPKSTIPSKGTSRASYLPWVKI